MSKMLVSNSAAGRLLSSTSGASVMAAIAMLATPQAGFAQATPQADGAPSDRASVSKDALQEIVVTAQKREENLQKVPVAVTALNTTAIENAQVRTFADLNGLAPNLTISQGPSTSTPIMVMRGIFSYSLANGVDAPIANYIDGVYYSRMIGASFDTADLERIEVLRGPQGTLYGRNSTGGAINFITAGPKGELYVGQELTIGDDDRRRSKTRIDLPKFGAFSVSGTFVHDQIDGYINNLTPGVSRDFSAETRGYIGETTSPENFGGSNSNAALFAARYAPDSLPLQADYRFSWSQADRTPTVSQVLGFPNTPTGQLAAGLFAVQPLVGGTGVVSTTRLSALPDSFSSPEFISTWAHSLTVAMDLPHEVQFKSITGYHGSTDSVVSDLTGNGDLIYPDGSGRPLVLLGTVLFERTSQFSEELQLNQQSALVDLIGGLYFSSETTLSVNPSFPATPVPLGTVPAGTTTSYNDSTAHNKSGAGFMQATFHVTNQVDVTGGARYTHDERVTDSRSVVNGIAIPDYSKDFNNVSWTTNVTYRPMDDYTFYAKAGTGYLSGGVFNGYAFEPEKLTQYELGAKLELLDRRLRVNAASYYSDYRNQQLGQVNSEGLLVYQNAAASQIYGGELEITAVPLTGLNLIANYGYTNFKYLKYVISGVDVAGSIGTPYIPTDTLTLGAQYELSDWSNGMKPSFNLGGNWHSKIDWAPYIETYSPAVLNALRDNSFWDIDARATLAAIPVGANLKGKVSIWGKNLLDQQKVLSGADLSLVVTANYNRGRTFGADFKVEF